MYSFPYMQRMFFWVIGWLFGFSIYVIGLSYSILNILISIIMILSGFFIVLISTYQILTISEELNFRLSNHR